MAEDSPERNSRVTEMPGHGHAPTIDHGWREVADTALTFVRRFVDPAAEAGA
ncbi:hypothetical protein [Streptomyces sp. NPDC058548]|uniref:hypothetical protein n=1 Tax=unclassified Streptomyces TaxID=2593676 RepID=UPI00364B8327